MSVSRRYARSELTARRGSARTAFGLSQHGYGCDASERPLELLGFTITLLKTSNVWENQWFSNIYKVFECFLKPRWFLKSSNVFEGFVWSTPCPSSEKHRSSKGAIKYKYIRALYIYIYIVFVDVRAASCQTWPQGPSQWVRVKTRCKNDRQSTQ